MGFIINADLETSQGPTQELYIRVEGFSFNKVTAELGFQITYWIVLTIYYLKCGK